MNRKVYLRSRLLLQLPKRNASQVRGNKWKTRTHIKESTESKQNKNINKRKNKLTTETRNVAICPV